MKIDSIRASQASIAAGERIYAIGDIHGRLDLFTTLIDLIRHDVEQRAVCRTRLLLIGDLIDRGPDSASLLATIRPHVTQNQGLIVLKGNHEQIMVEALQGDREALAGWLRFGGDQTLRSWGIPDAAFDGDLDEIYAAAKQAVPGDVIDWLDNLPTSYQSGDFFFVHAGIKPGVALKKQNERDMLWIGDQFLAHEEFHPAIIVHGHSIVEDGPIFQNNRIALDTGAYRTGKLSAVAFEGTRKWTITT